MSRKLPQDVPDFLRKRGIKIVSDNLEEGQCVAVDSKDFVLLFGDEILKRLKAKRHASEAATTK